MEFLTHLANTALSTVVDVAPIVAVLVFFQVVVLRRRLPNLGRIVAGFVYVLIGLTLFLIGLEEALFPIGETMARQLTAAGAGGVAAAGADELVAAGAVADAALVHSDGVAAVLSGVVEVGSSAAEAGGSFVVPGAERAAVPVVAWDDYLLVYAFAAAIGFATTVAEPSLIAVSLKAEEVSGGAVNAWGLRLAVAVGVAIGVSLGCFRIVTGTPLPWYIMAAYVVVILQTFRSSRTIVPLAYDSGGVTTSTVTVPVVAALGLGLAASVPGRSPLIDGFGLIAFASVFPIMSVLGYSMAATRLRRRRTPEPTPEPEH